MKRRTPRSLWPILALGVAALVVLTLLFSLIWRLLHPPVTPFVESDAKQVVIQVNVVNASGRNGAGRATMAFLRDRGFDVVEISTSAKPLQRSCVVDRLGDRQSSLKVAHVLGIADSLVVSEIDSMLFVRASVILGTDIAHLEPFVQ